MKIRMLTTAAGPDFVAHAGGVYEFSEARGLEFIAGKFAVPVKSTAKCAIIQTQPASERGPAPLRHSSGLGLEPPVSVAEAAGPAAVELLEKAVETRQLDLLKGEAFKTASTQSLLAENVPTT